jgi:hypothetical protein
MLEVIMNIVIGNLICEEAIGRTQDKAVREIMAMMNEIDDLMAILIMLI